MPEKGRLRIHEEGEVEVELVKRYLAELTRAYNSILLFEAMIDGLHRASRDFPFPRYPFCFYLDWR